MDKSLDIQIDFNGYHCISKIGLLQDKSMDKHCKSIDLYQDILDIKKISFHIQKDILSFPSERNPNVWISLDIYGYMWLSDALHHRHPRQLTSGQ
jgi:hypothetical protein